jgi:hypothetical protein
MQLGLNHFQYTYISDASNVVLLEVPVNIFEQYVTGKSLQAGVVYQQLKTVSDDKEQYRQSLIQSWQNTAHNLMTRKATDGVLVDDFISAMPLICAGMGRADIDLSNSTTIESSAESLSTKVQQPLTNTVGTKAPQRPTTARPSVLRAKVPYNVRGEYKAVAYKSSKEKALQLYHEMLKSK